MNTGWAGDVAQEAECLPNMHKPWFDPQQHIPLGTVAHACEPHTWKGEGWHGYIHLAGLGVTK